MKILKILIFALVLVFTSNVIYSKDISQTELNNIIREKLQEVYVSPEVQEYMIKLWNSKKFHDFKNSREYQSNLTLVKLDREISDRKDIIFNNLRKSNPEYDAFFSEIETQKKRYAGHWEGSDEYIESVYGNNKTLIKFINELDEKTAKDNIFLNLNLQYGNAFIKDEKLFKSFNSKFPEVEKFIREKIDKYLKEITNKHGKLDKVIANKFVPSNNIKFETYSSEGEPKSQGLNFTIDYPANWEIKDGKNPHVLKTFKYSYDNFIIMLIIQVQDLGTSNSNIELKAELDNMSEEEIKKIVNPYTLTKYEKREYNNQPGICLHTFYNQQIGREAFNIVGVNHLIYFNDALIMLMCQIWANENVSIEKLTQEANKYYPLFNKIGDSFVINNKEEYAQTHIRKYSYFQDLVATLYKEENLKELPEYILILLLFFSFLLTWGIALGEPLIIRYLILRRPMSKDSAIITSIILCVINITIFVQLGSPNKTHTALIIAAYISYLILKKKSKNNTDKDTLSDDKIKNIKVNN